MTTEHSMTVSFLVHDASGWSRDLPELLSCVRAGVAAWEQLPAFGVVDAALRPRHLEHLLEMCDELEAAHAVACEQVRKSWKDDRRLRRRELREATA